MRRRLLQFLKAGLSVALVVWIARTLDGHALAAAMRQLAPATVAVAALLTAAQAMIIGWRWHRIVSLLGGRLPPLDALKWVFVGLFFNNALPTSVGGDAVRIVLLRRSGASFKLAAGSVAIERGTGLVVLGLMVSACVPAVWSAVHGRSWSLTLALVGPALLAGLLVAAVADRVFGRWLPVGPAGVLTWLGDGLRRLALHPRSLAEIAGLGLAASFTGLLAAFVLGTGLGIDLGLPAYVVLVGGATLLSVLPISLGGWGVRELGMVALFGALGVGAERALALSLLWGLLPLLVSLPAGMLWWRDGGTPRASCSDSAPVGPALPRPTSPNREGP